MRVSSLFSLSAILIAAASASFIAPTTLDQEVVTQHRTEPPFIVEVVANGVPKDGKPYTPDPDQHLQLVGLDLWIGASAAYEDIKESQKGTESDLPFQLKGQNDTDDVEVAAGIAKSIQDDPRVLAVVGHGITQTTQTAAPFYSAARIPLVLALATADNAIRSNVTQKRLGIGFRLSPSDNKVQAPAIAYFITTHIYPNAAHSTTVHLYKSSADKAMSYSGPLCEETSAILSAEGINNHVFPVDTIQKAVEHVLTHPFQDFIVYCGYPTEAVQFVTALQEVYSKANAPKPPRFIFSDAAPEGFAKAADAISAYRTAALDTSRCTDQKTLEKLRTKANEVKRPLTDEQIHGYDAIEVLEAAALKCKNRLSRSCILQQLESGETFPSVCSSYSFRNGENIISDYFIFPEGNSKDEGNGGRLQPAVHSDAITLTAPEILRMLMIKERAVGTTAQANK